MRAIVVGLIAALFLVAYDMPSNAALAHPRPQPPRKHVLCSARSWELVGNGTLGVRNNQYTQTSEVRQCIEVLKNGGFRVVVSDSNGLHWPESYADVYQGCDIFGDCTWNSALPARFSRVKDVHVWMGSRLSTARMLAANMATDDYFTTGPLGSCSTIRAEFMLWATWHGVGVSTRARARFDGRLWDLNWWVTRHQIDGVLCAWNYLQVRPAYGQIRKVRNVDLMPMFDYFVRLGLIKTSWTLLQLAEGSECGFRCRGDELTGHDTVQLRR